MQRVSENCLVVWEKHTHSNQCQNYRGQLCLLRERLKMPGTCFSKLASNKGTGMWPRSAAQLHMPWSWIHQVRQRNKKRRNISSQLTLSFRYVSHVHGIAEFSRSDDTGQTVTSHAKWQQIPSLSLWPGLGIPLAVWSPLCLPFLLAQFFSLPGNFVKLPSSLSILPFVLELAGLGFHCLLLRILADTSSFWNDRKDRETTVELQNV